MAIGEFDVQPLFVEPVFRMDMGDAISKKQISFLKNLPMLQNKTNLISDNLYIFEAPEMKSIKAAVQNALNIYADKIMCISQKLYVTQSWTLINPPGAGMHGHSHSNSIVSGSLYFADLPEPNANMVFDRHNGYQRLQILPDGNRQNLYNTPSNSVTPKTNEIILFSSSLQHYVEANQSTQTRHSIAFNTFMKGQLGSYRDVSELTL